MAQIKKMMIQGIRSFDPDTNNCQTIEFYSPLTLIIGQNGCGKTTIIEALKFAITNEYPPGTTKGGSFIHDPKLSNGYDVMAMVKLELKDRNGDRIVLTRRLKGTQKGVKGNVTTSTVEASLRRLDKTTGTVKDMSGKCADVKDEMARLMGVSEAILNHVILCHQEDSCWPLDEGKKVKERFDAIFNTTMYMKALERLVNKDKAIASDIRVWDEKYSHGKVILREMIDKQNQAETLNGEIKSLAVTIEKYTKESEDLEVKIRALQSLEQDYEKIKASLEYQERTIREGEKFIAEQTAIIGRVREGTVEDLDRAIANFETGRNDIQRRLRSLEGEERTKANELDALTKQKEKINEEKGMLTQAEKNNEEAKSKVKALTSKVVGMMRVMKENSQETSFTTTANEFLDNFEDGSSSGEHMKQPDIVVKVIMSALKTKQAEEKKLDEEFQDREKELQKKVDKLRESVASTEKEIEMKRKDVDANNKTLSELRSKLSSLEGSGDALLMLNDDIETNEAKIEQINSSKVIEKGEEDIQKLQKELKALQQRRDAVKREFDLLRADKNIADKIQILTKQKQEKQNGRKEILSRSEDRIREVLGSIPEDDLTSALDNKIRTLNREISEKERQQKAKMQELSSKQAEKKHVLESLSKKEAQLEEWNDKAEELLEGGLFDELYEDCTTKLAEAQRENYFNEAAQFLYGKYVAKLRSNNCCPLCKRDFKTKKENAELVQSIQDQVQTLKDGQPEGKLKVEKLEQQSKNLSEFKPIWDEMKSLEDDEIPGLKRRKSSLESAIINLDEENQELGDTLDVLKNDLAIANTLKRDAVLYDQLAKDTQKLDVDIKRCERERTSEVKGCAMTFEEAEAEMEEIDRSIKTKQTEKESKESMKSKKEKELAKAVAEKNEAVKQQLELKSAMQNRVGLESEKRKLENSNKELSAAVEELQKKLPSARSEISKIQNAKDEAKREHDLKIYGIRKEETELEKHKDSMIVLKKQLESFEDQKRSFEQKQKQFAHFGNRLTDCESSLKDIRKDIEDSKVELATSETNLQALNISIQIKKKEAELEDGRKQKKVCEEAIAASRSRGATHEKRQLLDKHSSIQRQGMKSKGQMEEKQSMLAQIRAELVAKDKPYLNAEVQFKEALVRKVVYEKARKDMRIYRTALEHAVLTFHHKKMETINKYLKCFWKKVYRGNDIEYIQIKTDNEDASKPANDFVKIDFTKNKRRTYNYRVVMIRRGVEQDMRGHCSAGQKILASILIRLALAQTFSCKCGLITLDEPTTNLDKANIDSLAETLSDLALDMRDMKTYQLVVITHDQDFVDKLLRVDPVEYYFKVSRNQNGHSKIERMFKTSS